MARREQDGQEARRGWTLQKLLIAALAVLVVVWLVLTLPDFAARAELGSGYAARIGCSCHFVEKRDLASCEGDLEAAAWLVSIEADEEARTVTGSVPLFASRTARYRPGWGCGLDPME